jgi:hypothetical protein
MARWRKEDFEMKLQIFLSSTLDDGRGIGVQFLEEARDISIVHDVQTVTSPSSAEVKNKWIYTATPPRSPHGVALNYHN